jgi:serine/threonine-protein kinase RsbW
MIAPFSRVFQLEARLSAIAAAREFVAQAARDAGLSDDRVNHAQLIVDEHCTNVIEHGYQRESSEHAIVMQCEGGGQRLVITLTDAGKPFNPLTAPDAQLHAISADDSIGGWGIYFIRQLADTLEYEYRDGTNRFTVTLTNRAHPS